MRPTEPLPLHHTWPLDAQAAHFARYAAPHPGGGGRWRCTLPDNRLEWDEGVFDLFGLPRTAPLTRDLAVRCYEEGSRTAMEKLRAYAIRYRRGFTLDVEVGPPAGPRNLIRLVASPVLQGNRVVALEGMKFPLAG